MPILIFSSNALQVAYVGQFLIGKKVFSTNNVDNFDFRVYRMATGIQRNL